jgi:hypothetical protein
MGLATVPRSLLVAILGHLLFTVLAAMLVTTLRSMPTRVLAVGLVMWTRRRPVHFQDDQLSLGFLADSVQHPRSPHCQEGRRRHPAQQLEIMKPPGHPVEPSMPDGFGRSTIARLWNIIGRVGANPQFHRVSPRQRSINPHGAYPPCLANGQPVPIG